MMTLVYLGSAWLLGVYVGSLVSWPAYGLVVAASLPLGFAVAARRRPRIALAALCLALASLGAARLAAVRPTLAANDIATRNDGESLAFRGTVAAYPDARGTYTNLNVHVTEARTGGGWGPATGHVLVRTAPYPAFDYGDRIEVWGKPETPPVFPDFSYKDYLARKGIHSLVRYAQVSKRGSGAGQPLFTLLYGIRSRAQQVIAQILPEPQAALLTGILLGLEAGIPRDLMADFNATGTTHIIVISGFNITIIAGLFLALGRRTLGRKWATYATVAGIAVYTILVGADAAVVRAAFMGVLYVWSLHLGRLAEAVTSLVFASFLMTLLNPWTLWDLGFQLSFLATLSLIRFTPALQTRFEAFLARLWRRPVTPAAMALLNDALIVTLAAQIMTTPLIVAVFGRLSLVSLLTNFLILPIQPAVMISGGVATIGGLIALPLGRLLAWFPWLTLTYTIRLVEWTARVPYASLELGRFSEAWLLPYYVLLLAGPAWSRRLRAATRGPRARLPGWLRPLWRPQFGLGILALGAILSLSVAINQRDGRLHVDVLDVGEGNAVLIVTPSGDQLLVDGGPDPTRLLPRLGRAMPFWDRTVEWIVVTRLTGSHLAGLVPVLERYHAGGVLVPAGTGRGTAYAAWVAQIEERDVPVVRGHDGQEIALGEGVTLEVLSPATASDEAELLLMLRWDQACFLLAQGLDEAREAEVLRRYRSLPCAVLVAGRNGSKHATTNAFLTAVQPALVIIPVGADNRFGHPAAEVLERVGDRVLRTDRDGNIEITTDGKQYWLRTGQ